MDMGKRRQPCFVASPSHFGTFQFTLEAHAAEGCSYSDICKGASFSFVAWALSDTELTRLYLPESMQTTTGTTGSYSKLSVWCHVSIRTQVYGAISAHRGGTRYFAVHGFTAFRASRAAIFWVQLRQDCMTA